MKKLVLWEINNSLLPTDPGERIKLISTMLGEVKKDVDSGRIEWGASSSVMRGYVVSEQDEKEIYSKAMMFSPYATFEVITTLSVDEAIDAIKGMAK